MASNGQPLKLTAGLAVNGLPTTGTPSDVTLIHLSRYGQAALDIIVHDLQRGSTGHLDEVARGLARLASMLWDRLERET